MNCTGQVKKFKHFGEEWQVTALVEGKNGFDEIICDLDTADVFFCRFLAHLSVCKYGIGGNEGIRNFFHFSFFCLQKHTYVFIHAGF